jgi:Tfp pilus assembly PilM family ATPase
MFSGQCSPIAIDFGSTSLKLLQTSGEGKPSLVSALEMPVPEQIRLAPMKLFQFYEKALPNALSSGRFKGKRVVVAVPSSQTYIQHMQLLPADGVKLDDLVKGQLQVQLNCTPDSVVVRTVDVAEVNRDGQARREVICFAISRENVMRYVSLFRKFKLETVGVHTQAMAMVRAFDHLNRREEDAEVTTLYVEMGWSGTRVAITHGRQIVFARLIQIGGRHFDQHIASSLHCDLSHARTLRLTIENDADFQPVPDRAGVAAEMDGMGVLGAVVGEAEGGGMAVGETPATTAADRRTGSVPRELQQSVPAGVAPTHLKDVDLTELLDTITDEFSMCLRYHQGLFPDRRLNRVIFVGGESRQAWLCQHLVRALRVPARLGDPLARLRGMDAKRAAGIDLDSPQPGWAVACGLCTAHNDL